MFSNKFNLFWATSFSYTRLFGLVVSNEGNKFYKIDTSSISRSPASTQRDRMLEVKVSYLERRKFLESIQSKFLERFLLSS
jgi:hypothetical protein